MRGLRSIAFGLCLTAALSPALGAEWAIDSNVGSRIEHNDNWRLTSTNEQAVTVLSVAPFARFSTSTEISALSFELGATGYKAFGDDTLTRLDGSVGFGARTRSERAQYSLDGRFLRDSTLATELRQTGVVVDRVQRNFYGLQGGYKFALTQRVNALANSGVQIARYERTVQNGLRDYNQYSLGGGLEYLITERTTVGTQIGWSRFTTVPFVNRARVLSWNNSIEHRFTETLKGSASLGLARVNTEIQEFVVCFDQQALRQAALADCTGTGRALTQLRPSIDSNTTNKLYGAQLDWQFGPVSSWNGGARQEILPSAIGTVVRTLVLFTGVNHTFTEKLRGGADVRYTDSSFVGAAGLGVDTKALFLGAQVIYQFTREWSFETGARRTQVSYSNSAANADANVIYGQVRYEWPRLSVAR